MSFRTRTAALLGLLLCVLTLLTTPLAPARAQQADPIAIELTSITPSVLTNSGDLVISGTITNTSPDVLQRCRGPAWRDATPPTTLDAPNEDPNALAPRGGDGIGDRPAIHQRQPRRPPRAPAPPSPSGPIWGRVPRSNSGLREPDAAYRVGAEAGAGWSGQRRLPPTGTQFSPDRLPWPAAGRARHDRPAGPSAHLLPLVAESEQRVFVIDDRLSGQLTGRLKIAVSACRPARCLGTARSRPSATRSTPWLSPHLVLGADGIPVPGVQHQPNSRPDWLIGLDWLIEAGKVAHPLRWLRRHRRRCGEPPRPARPDRQRPAGRTTPLADLPLVVVGPDAQMSCAGLALLGDVQPQLVLANPAGSDLAAVRRHAPCHVELTHPASGQSAAVLAGEFSSRQLVGARQGRPLVSPADSEEGARLVRSCRPARGFARRSPPCGRSARGDARPDRPRPRAHNRGGADLVQATDRTMAEVRPGRPDR